jgi:hypothetical protein
MVRLNIIKKIKVLLGLKRKWICLKGKQLKLTTGLGWTGNYSVKYELIKGSYTKKDSHIGKLGDDAEIYSIFKPKSQQVKLLVWVNFTKYNPLIFWSSLKQKTKRYLVILNKKYKKNVIIDEN